MTEQEFLDQLDAWALGALSDVERAAMERYVAAHPSAREAMRRAFDAAALLGRALPPSPPPAGAWDRIAAALPGASTTAPAAPAPAARGRGRELAGWLVAAVAAAAAVWLLLDRGERADELARTRDELAARDAELTARRDDLLASTTQLDGCRSDLEALRARDALANDAVALLELPGTQLIPLEHPTPPPAGAPAPAANAIYHRGVKKAYVVAKGLPAEPDAYRIWVNRGGQRLPAGELVATADGSVIASVPQDTLTDVPESFQITRASGELVLESRMKI